MLKDRLIQSHTRNATEIESASVHDDLQHVHQNTHLGLDTTFWTSDDIDPLYIPRDVTYGHVPPRTDSLRRTAMSPKKPRKPKVRVESMLAKDPHKGPPILPAAPIIPEITMDTVQMMPSDFFFDHFGPLTKEETVEEEERIERATRVMSRFDLSAFAQQLNDNRLSVVQPRQSHIVMTEEDEMEFVKLMAQQKIPLKKTLAKPTKTETDDVSPVEDNKSLEAEKDPEPEPEKEKEAEKEVEKEVEKEETIDAKDDPEPLVDEQEPKDLVVPVEKMMIMDEIDAYEEYDGTDESDYMEEIELIREFNNENHALEVIEESADNEEFDVLEDNEKIKGEEEITSKDENVQEIKVLSPDQPEPPTLTQVHLMDPKENLEYKNTPPLTGMYNTPLLGTSTMEEKLQISDLSLQSHVAPLADHTQDQKVPRLRRLLNSKGVSGNTRFRELLDMNVSAPAPAALAPPPPQVSVTMSISSPLKQGTQEPASENLPKDPKPTRSLGLFGSLRQATRSRSQSTTSIRGLMRSWGSTGNLRRQDRHSSPLGDTKEENEYSSDGRLLKPGDKATMSRAAMAVVQHTVAKKNGAPVLDEYRQGNLGLGLGPEKKPLHEPKGGSRLLSNLLAKATTQRKITKIVNMKQDRDGKEASSERAKVIRRTIIYVPPDSANFMKSLREPPVPPLPKVIPGPSSSKPVSMVGSDVSEGEYGQATVVTRQPSTKRYLKSSAAHNTPAANQPKPALEGVELREMSDGSVVWGIVQNHGNRKSFYAPKSSTETGRGEGGYEYVEEEEEETEEEVEERVLALMGLQPIATSEPEPVHSTHHGSASSSLPPPLPQKSSRRRAASVDRNTSQRYPASQPYRHDAHAEHVSTIARQDDSTTDIYYAPEMTLNNLVQIMASKRVNTEEVSIEEQLDQVMESFRCH
ncbi:hypothetical protein CLU79DRAFT_837623 [Phycomyces nitens]|nr:hypothetical protein CLU79DRAFT_837623 [Phycomyces nitens]